MANIEPRPDWPELGVNFPAGAAWAVSSRPPVLYFDEVHERAVPIDYERLENLLAAFCAKGAK